MTHHFESRQQLSFSSSFAVDNISGLGNHANLPGNPQKNKHVSSTDTKLTRHSANFNLRNAKSVIIEVNLTYWPVLNPAVAVYYPVRVDSNF